MSEQELVKKFRQEWTSDTPYITVHTSGSTGNPKEISLSKENIKASARRTIGFFGLGPDSLIYSCVSVSYIGGKMMAVRAWETGCDFLFEEPSNNPALEVEDNRKIDLLSVVPSQMDTIVNDPELYGKVRRFLVGGSPLTSQLQEKISDLGLDVWESYGMTETCSHIALRKVCHKSIGFQALEGIEVRKDNRGCLDIRIGDERFITNDLVEILCDGTFRILGRADNVIISGAKKAHPEEMERLLESWFDKEYGIKNLEYAVSSRKDKKWGERILLVNSRPDIEIDLEKLKNARILEAWSVPKETVIVDKIPLTPNGKIDRARLRAICRQNF